MSTGPYGAYYVGSTLLRHFYPPRPTHEVLVDGHGIAISPKTGYPYVGYVCGAFQRKEVIFHLNDKAARQSGNKQEVAKLDRGTEGVTRASVATHLMDQHRRDLAAEQYAPFQSEREQVGGNNGI